jgi:hypothetical protein
MAEKASEFAEPLELPPAVFGIHMVYVGSKCLYICRLFKWAILYSFLLNFLLIRPTNL